MKVLMPLLLLVADGVATAAALLLLYLFRFGIAGPDKPIPSVFGLPLVILTAFWWAVLALKGLYRNIVSITRFDEIYDAFNAVLIGIVLIFMTTFEVRAPLRLTRMYLLAYGGLLFIFVAMGRMALREFQIWLRWRGIGMSRALIVGFNDVGRRLCAQLKHQPVWGFQVVGFVDDAAQGEYEGIPVIATKADLPGVALSRRVDWILLAPPSQDDRSRVFRVLDDCLNLPIRFMIVADYYDMVVGFVSRVRVHGQPLMEVGSRRVPFLTKVVKRLTDLIAGLIATIALVVATPFIALAIALDSRGPIFTRQPRIGKGERQFRILNYRIHRQPEEPASPLTRVGVILRRLHIDRLPEGWDVLTGRMSLVGPMPESPEFVARFLDKIPLYRRRFAVQPGVTGWAQIRYRYGDTLEEVTEKTKYDLYYIEHLSPALDLWIILGGLRRILRPDT